MSLISQMREKWARKRAAKTDGGLLVMRSKLPAEKKTAFIEKYRNTKSELERNTLVGQMGDLVFVGRLRDMQGKLEPGDIFMTDEDLQRTLDASATLVRPQILAGVR